MNPKSPAEFRQHLLSLRYRVGAEIDHLTGAVRDSAGAAAQSSAAPVHLADAADSGLETDVAVLGVTDHLLSAIDAALGRIEDGTFGRCVRCGRDISRERLSALPHAALCARCAHAGAVET